MAEINLSQLYVNVLDQGSRILVSALRKRLGEVFPFTLSRELLRVVI
jgi:hypothetical protein